ncbi:MAG: hypothetical protein WD226_13610 [Planctomycetota bacterium]
MRARLALLLALVPIVLFAPIVLSGALFLPLLPGGLEPLATEDRERAAAAFRDANFSQSDRLFPVLTDQLALRESLLRGELPTWEPDLALGYPLAGGSIAAPWYPPNFVGLLAGPAGAAGPLAALSLGLAGLGALLFLRRLGLGLGPALVGTIAYQLGGFGLANLFYAMKLDAALWLPWSLWAIEGLRERRRGSALALGLSVALSWLAGFAPIAIFHLTIAGLWALARLLGRRGAPPEEVATGTPRLVVAGLVVAAGCAIAAIGVLPFAATASRSIRTERSVANLAADSLPASLPAFLGLVVADFVDRPTSSAPPGTQPVAWWITPEPQVEKANEKANALEWNLYAGAAVVALALIGVVHNTRRARFPALVLLGTLGFAQAWPVLQPLFRVPGLNLGSPARALSMAWFLWPWLAALGVDALGRGRAAITLAGLAGTAAVAFCVGAWWLGPERFSEHALSVIVAEYGPAHGIDRAAALAKVGGLEAFHAAGVRLEHGFAGAAASLAALALAALALVASERPATTGARALVAALVGGALALALAPLLFQDTTSIVGVPISLVVVSGALALSAVALRPRPLAGEGRWLPIALVVLIEGLLGASGHVTAREEPAGELFPADSPALSAVARTAGDGRVLRFDPTGTSHVEALARPNMLQPYGVADLAAWIVFTPRTLVELAGAIDARPGYDMRFRTGIASLRSLEHVTHPLFDAWNVTCVLARDPLSHPALEETYSAPGFHVYRRAGALGPARLVGTAVAATTDDVGIALLASGTIDPRVTCLVPPGTATGAPTDVRAAARPVVERLTKSTLDVTLAASPGGWLVVSEQWAPGWRATIDGADVPVVRADHTLRAVRVPAGTVRVRFRYAPTTFLLAGMACLAGLLLIGFVEWRLLSRRTAR